MNTQDKEKALTLELLQAVDQESDMTQRTLAASLGVALGLANAYLKRCIRKGLIKVRQAPANRYFYYLTPKGFAEKSRLTAEYLRHSFNFYRHASESMRRIFKTCELKGHENILLCGVSELAEISLVRALEHPVKITAVFDAGTDKNSYLGLTVHHSLAEIGPVDVFVITDIYSAETMYTTLAAHVDPHRILVPDILGINQSGADTQ